MLELGPITVLLKPFRLGQVIECVEQIVGKRLRRPGYDSPDEKSGSGKNPGKPLSRQADVGRHPVCAGRMS